MKTSTIVPTLATLAAVSDAQGLFPDCAHGPLANTTVCNPNASMSNRPSLESISLTNNPSAMGSCQCSHQPFDLLLLTTK